MRQKYQGCIIIRDRLKISFGMTGQINKTLLKIYTYVYNI